MKRGRAFSETKNLLLDFLQEQIVRCYLPGSSAAYCLAANSNQRGTLKPEPTIRSDAGPVNPPATASFRRPMSRFHMEGIVLAISHITGDSGRCQRWARSEDDTGRRWAAILPTRRGTLFLTSGAAETATGCDQRRPAALELGSAGEWARRRAPARTRRSDG
jgi:hypothetical protein